MLYDSSWTFKDLQERYLLITFALYFIFVLYIILYRKFPFFIYIFYCASSQIINVLWWYYFSKLIEFMDTFFFILRKNNHQITFLHIYHHASMLNIWWFVMNWLPCGHCECFNTTSAASDSNLSSNNCLASKRAKEFKCSSVKPISPENSAFPPKEDIKWHLMTWTLLHFYTLLYLSCALSTAVSVMKLPLKVINIPFTIDLNIMWLFWSINMLDYLSDVHCIISV